MSKLLSRSPDLVLPAWAQSMKPKRGMVFPDLRSLGVVRGQGGGERGYNAVGDVVTRTTDGRDLNALWNEFQATLALQNAQRQSIMDFLTFGVTNIIEDVLQAGTGANFEVASEYGEPVGVRTKLSYFSMSYDFTWYDIAARFTWMFLAEASASQVEAVHATVLEADNRNMFDKVMRTVFNNTNLTTTITGNPYTVYKFYNADGTLPPTFKTNTFLGTHQHYLTSGAAAIDSGDVEQIQDHLNHHGFTKGLGYRLVLMVNKVQGDSIRTWRLNVTSANAAVAKYDFIPARGREDLVFSATQQVTGNQPDATLGGLDVIGSYGDFLIVQDDFVPIGYMFGFATGGQANLGNPIGLREHVNPALRGLRLVKGRTPDYPLVDSFYSRGFGAGVRQRGGGVVMQVTAAGTYAPPTAYTAP